MQYLARLHWKNHTEENHCLVVKSHTTNNEIPLILWNLKNCDLVRSRRTLNPTLARQIQSISALTTSARLILILSYRPRVVFQVDSYYWALPKKICLPNPSCQCYISHRSHPSSFRDSNQCNLMKSVRFSIYSFLLLLPRVSQVLIYLAFSLCRLTAQIGSKPPLCEFYRPHTSRDTHPLQILCTSDQPVAEAANYATHNKHKGQTFMPSAGFEPAITAAKRLQTYALDRTATTFGIFFSQYTLNFPQTSSVCSLVGPLP